MPSVLQQVPPGPSLGGPAGPGRCKPHADLHVLGEPETATERPSQRPSEPPHRTGRGSPLLQAHHLWDSVREELGKSVMRPSLSPPAPASFLGPGSCREREIRLVQPSSPTQPDCGSTLHPGGPWPTPFGSSLRLCRGKGCANSCLDFSWCCSVPSPPRSPEPHTPGTPPFTSSPPGSPLLPAGPRALRGDTTGARSRSPAVGAWVRQTAPVGPPQRPVGGQRHSGDGLQPGPAVVTAAPRPSEPQFPPSGPQRRLCDALIEDAYPESREEGKPQSKDVLQNNHSRGFPRSVEKKTKGGVSILQESG